MEFKRNPETGIVEVWLDGVKVGEMLSMGDVLEEEQTDG